MIDRCYECSGYGDDYYYDAEKDELVSACPTCPFRDLHMSDKEVSEDA